MALPVTTIVPFASLPTCAVQCGHLYDVNGACVPPAVPAGNLGSYASCFCGNSLVAPFSTGTTGVCDTACTAVADKGGLESIHNWFTSFCSANAKNVATKTTTSSSTAAGEGSNGSSSQSSNNGHSSWMSTHWRWVVFIVVVVVGIIVIWIGACVWHRRYLRRKDRQYALGNPMIDRTSIGAPTAAGLASQPNTQVQPEPAYLAGSFPAGIDNAYAEKRQSNLQSRQRN